MRITARHRLLPLLAALVVAGLVVLAASAPRAFSDTTRPELGEWGVDLSARDTSVEPGDDFFRYANGAWLESYEIPADLPGTGSFISLFLKSEQQVKEIILDSASENPEAGSIAWKVGTLYNQYSDTATIEEKGLTPLDPYVEQIRTAEGHDRIANLMAVFDRVDGGGWGGGAGMTIFPFFIYQDQKDPSKYVAYLSGAGLALPDRDYYLVEDNERFAAARAAYLGYLTEMFTLAGEENAAERAQAILDLETRIAEAHWPAEELRDREKTFNRMTLDEITALAPDFPWSDYLAAAGLSSQDYFIVDAKSTFTDMATIFRETDAETWKDFLVHRLMHVNASLLPKAVDDAQFTFTSTALTGSQQQRERDKRATQFTNGALGEAIGQIYVSRHFPPEAKAQVEELVENLRIAMAKRIDGLEWMGEETKKQAHDKLAKFTVKIGYPDEWRDYSNLEVKEDDLLGNAMRARAFNHDRNLSKLDGPVDPNEWYMSPQTVNAYYNPTMNEIVFPAGILQPPFFDPNADPAVNYGGIGAVIGHEIGHGFDDQGRKSDGDGVMRDWWTEDDAVRFQERANVLVEQYNGFSPLEGMFVNGELTLGENIGDLGGLEIAYHAYKLSLDGKEAPVIDGMTGDQRFFLGFAQIWKGKMRDQIMASLITSNPHSPVEYRVNGVLPNMDAWYDAFDVTPEHAMYLPPEERVHIW